MPPNHPVIHWMVEYASETINRFRIIRKASTSRELLKGKREIMRMAEFGESVLWLPETRESGRMEKLEPKFEKGVWLGVCPRTDKAMIGTATGIVRAGTVKRQTIEEAWNAEQLLAITLTPWTVGRKSDRYELVIDDDGEVEVMKPDGTDALADPRRLRTTKEYIEVIGYSDGCVGSSLMRMEKTAQMHSKYCWRRVKEHLMGTDEGRGKNH